MLLDSSVKGTKFEGLKETCQLSVLGQDLSMVHYE